MTVVGTSSQDQCAYISLNRQGIHIQHIPLGLQIPHGHTSLLSGSTALHTNTNAIHTTH